jgi:hypothetical protein
MSCTVVSRIATKVLSVFHPSALNLVKFPKGVHKHNTHLSKVQIFHKSLEITCLSNAKTYKKYIEDRPHFIKQV